MNKIRTAYNFFLRGFGLAPVYLTNALKYNTLKCQLPIALFWLVLFCAINLVFEIEYPPYVCTAANTYLTVKVKTAMPYTLLIAYNATAAAVFLCTHFYSKRRKRLEEVYEIRKELMQEHNMPEQFPKQKRLSTVILGIYLVLYHTFWISKCIALHYFDNASCTIIELIMRTIIPHHIIMVMEWDFYSMNTFLIKQFVMINMAFEKLREKPKPFKSPRDESEFQNTVASLTYKHKRLVRLSQFMNETYSFELLLNLLRVHMGIISHSYTCIYLILLRKYATTEIFLIANSLSILLINLFELIGITHVSTSLCEEVIISH